VLGLRKCGLEIIDVFAHRLRIAHADRRIAGRRLAARASGVAEHFLRQRWIFREVLIDECVAGAAEAVQAIFDIGRVAWLGKFAVVDQVDTRIGLPLHHFGDRSAHPRRKGLRVYRHAFFLGVHHADQVFRPRQAARVRGEKALGASFHFWSSRRAL